MGRISEFFDYIRRKNKLDEVVYTNLTFNEKIKKARKEYLKQKRGTK